MLNMKYLPRIADAELKSRLNYMGAVLIEGPKWCGKTTTAIRAFSFELLYVFAHLTPLCGGYARL